MLDALRKVLGFRVTVGELIVVALVVGTPYLVVGVFWSSTHTDHLQHMDGVDLAVPISARSCRGRCCCSPTFA